MTDLKSDQGFKSGKIVIILVTKASLLLNCGTCVEKPWRNSLGKICFSFIYHYLLSVPGTVVYILKQMMVGGGGGGGEQFIIR